MFHVESNHIDSIGHDPAKRELHVLFKNGDRYSYADVTAAEHAALMASDSKGSHLHANIKASKKATKK